MDITLYQDLGHTDYLIERLYIIDFDNPPLEACRQAAIQAIHDAWDRVDNVMADMGAGGFYRAEYDPVTDTLGQWEQY